MLFFPSFCFTFLMLSPVPPQDPLSRVPLDLKSPRQLAQDKHLARALAAVAERDRQAVRGCRSAR